MDKPDRHQPLDFFHIQLELECKGFDENGDLIQIPGDDHDEINRFHIVKYPGGCFRYFRCDVPKELRGYLNRFSDEQVLN